MAPQKSKKREKLEANNGSPTWPDLPEQLIDLISSEPTLMATIRGNGVTKSWRSSRNVSCRCLSSSGGSHHLPWLEISDHPLESKPVRLYSSTSFHRKIRKPNCYPEPWFVNLLNSRGNSSSSVDQFHGHWSKGCWIKKTYSLVWKSITGDQLPSYRCNMALPNGRPYEWKKLDCDIIDPNRHDPFEPSHFFSIANGIGIHRRFYVISLQGTLAVVEEAGSDLELKITRIKRRRVIPSVKSKYFREFMLESDGKVLVVFLVSGQSIEVVDDVEVYQVDADDLALVKKKSINGGRSLFLGTNCAISVLASQVVGCRSNCVYFSIYPGHGWWVYDMETNNITTCQLLV